MFLSFVNWLRKSPFILVLLWCCKQLLKWMLLLLKNIVAFAFLLGIFFLDKYKEELQEFSHLFILSFPPPSTQNPFDISKCASWERVFRCSCPSNPVQSSGRAAGGCRTGPPQPCPSLCFAWAKASRRCTWLCGSPRPCCPSISSTALWLAVRDRKMK